MHRSGEQAWHLFESSVKLGQAVVCPEAALATLPNYLHEVRPVPLRSSLEPLGLSACAGRQNPARVHRGVA